MTKLIQNLEEKTQSVLMEGLSDDAAELAGVDKDIVDDAVKGLSYANYLELGNAIDIGDAETVKEILGTVADLVPGDDIDLEESDPFYDKPIPGKKLAEPARSWGEILWKLSDEKLTRLYNKKMKDCGGAYNPGTSAVTPIKREMELRGLLEEGWPKGWRKPQDPWMPDVPVPDKFKKDGRVMKRRKGYKAWLQSERDKASSARLKEVEDFELEEPIDMMGKPCYKCKKGYFTETGFHDDMDGVQHCSECGWKTDRYLTKFEQAKEAGLNEADNPSAPAAATPAQPAVTPPSAGSSIDAVAQPAETAVDKDNNEMQQGRKEVDDLDVGDEIEVADIDGEPAAGRVRNANGPGNTIVITGKGDEEHMIRKDSILSTPIIDVGVNGVQEEIDRLKEQLEASLDEKGRTTRIKNKTKLGDKMKRAERIEKKKQNKEIVESVQDIDVGRELKVGSSISLAGGQGGEVRVIMPKSFIGRAAKVRFYGSGHSGQEFFYVRIDDQNRVLPNKVNERTNVNEGREAKPEDLERIQRLYDQYKTTPRFRDNPKRFKHLMANMMQNLSYRALDNAYNELGIFTDLLGEEDEEQPKGVNDKYDAETLNCKHCGDYYCTSKFGGECPGIQRDLFDESWPQQEETYDEMVEYWKGSLSRSIVSKGVFTQLYDAAGKDIDELNRAIEDEAHSIADSYHGTGEGIGSSDQNHFIASIGSSLGVEDVFGWNKPKLASDEEMERDKANRAAKFGKAIRAESLDEDWMEDAAAEDKITAEFNEKEWAPLGFKRNSNWPGGTTFVANGDPRKLVRAKFKQEGWQKQEDMWWKHPTLNYMSAMEFNRGRVCITSMPVPSYMIKEADDVCDGCAGSGKDYDPRWGADTSCQDCQGTGKKSGVIEEGTEFHFYVEPQEVGALVVSSKGAVHDFYEDPEEARRVAAELNAEYGKVEEDVSFLTFDEIKEIQRAAGIEPVTEVKSGRFKSKAIGNMVKIVGQDDYGNSEHDGKIGTIISAEREHTFSQMVPFRIVYGIRLEDGTRVYVRRNNIRKVKAITEGSFGVYRKSKAQMDSDDGHTAARSSLVKRGGKHVTFKSKKQADTWVKTNSKGENMFVRKVSKPVAETASGGATGAGAVATGVAAVGGPYGVGGSKPIRRGISGTPSIYGKTKLRKKPEPKKRKTSEDAGEGIGRSKKK